MSLHGIVLGLASFLSIGIFHPIVIKCEYYFSYRIWPLFLAAGVVLLGASVSVEALIPSAMLGVVGFSCFWSIVELFAQHQRVEKGWFPANPKFHPCVRTEEGLKSADDT